jgi:2-C-methyl-D-erythritol 4-phosphate cytidylyltransferase
MRQKNCTAILLGAGKGTRLQQGKNKIFLEIAGKSLLQITTENILKFSRIDSVIFVVALKEKTKVQKILESFWNFSAPFSIISGGQHRWQSSVLGVEYYKKCAKKNSCFFIHDLARPFVSQEQIQKLYDACLKNKVSAPYLEIKDTIRQKNPLKNLLLDKEKLFGAQTPQFFDYQLAPFFQKPSTPPSDDIFFAEQENYPISWIKGEEQNIKVTTAFDLQFAKFLIEQKSQK